MKAFAVLVMLLLIGLAGACPALGDEESGDSKGPSAVAASEKPGSFALNGVADRGAEVYQKNCIACHGEKGDGKGPLAAAFNPSPTDFTDAEEMSTRTEEYLYTVVKEGGPSMEKCVEMGAWKHVLSDQAIRDAVAYVRGFCRTLSANAGR